MSVREHQSSGPQPPSGSVLVTSSLTLIHQDNWRQELEQQLRWLPSGRLHTLAAVSGQRYPALATVIEQPSYRLGPFPIAVRQLDQLSSAEIARALASIPYPPSGSALDYPRLLRVNGQRQAWLVASAGQYQWRLRSWRTTPQALVAAINHGALDGVGIAAIQAAFLDFSQTTQLIVTEAQPAMTAHYCAQLIASTTAALPQAIGQALSEQIPVRIALNAECTEALLISQHGASRRWQAQWTRSLTICQRPRPSVVACAPVINNEPSWLIVA
jgi:hypothetical protein